MSYDNYLRNSSRLQALFTEVLQELYPYLLFTKQADGSAFFVHNSKATRKVILG